MDPAVLVIPIIVAIAAPVGAYLLAARKMSGKIGTSDASELWEESRSIRDDYRNRLLTAAERAVSLEMRVAALEGTNAELVNQNLDLVAKVGKLETLVETLRATITKLEETIEHQRTELGRA